MQKILENIYKEPYRLFFPLGVFCLLWGALIWVPLIWNGENYPVLAHRYLMLNGFAGCFIGGFLMTAVPKFSQTWTASKGEVRSFLFLTLLGLVFAYFDSPGVVFLMSSLQPLLLLVFIIPRMRKRGANPPYSFVFIFVGLFLWVISGLLSIYLDSENFKHLHYEGSIACIILGVGSRLIPGILGHVEIVKSQRKRYEKPLAILKTVPRHFAFMIISFVGSYLLPDEAGAYIRAVVVLVIGFIYWRLWQFPREKTALTWSIWLASWMIMISFGLKPFWHEGLIHISHSFFISGIVLLSLLIATRVIQSHGPQDKSLEQRKVLLVITFLLILTAATRVSAFLMADLYLSHLAYSSILLVVAVLVWGANYLPYVVKKNVR